jgi:hypothetical protein
MHHEETRLSCDFRHQQCLDISGQLFSNREGSYVPWKKNSKIRGNVPRKHPMTKSKKLKKNGSFITKVSFLLTRQINCYNILVQILKLSWRHAHVISTLHNFDELTPKRYSK